MGRKKFIPRKNSSQSGFNIPLSIATFFIGVILTFAVTRVFAQNADTNQIYACVHNTNGNVRIVTASDTCKQQEKSIKWSIQGPPGPPGPAGQTGGLNQYFGMPFMCNGCYLANLADRFAGKDFSYARITRSDFSGANLMEVNFKNGFLSQNNFRNANLSGADLSGITEMPNGEYSQNNRFIEADLTNVNFSNSLHHEFDFTNADLQNANFSNTILRSVKFRGARNMSTANFSNAIFENVTCPDGSNSDNNANSCEGHF